MNSFVKVALTLQRTPQHTLSQERIFSRPDRKEGSADCEFASPKGSIRFATPRKERFCPHEKSRDNAVSASLRNRDKRARQLTFFAVA